MRATLGDGVTKGSTMNETTGTAATTSAILNRHMARLLGELEGAGCPALFRDAVKAKMIWLRDDLAENERHARNERYDYPQHNR